MKIIARIGAVLSFAFLSAPGLALISHTREHGEMGEAIFGSVFIGIGCFAGTLLWLMGEKCGAKPDGR